MKHLSEWPAPLLRKWLLSAALGVGFLTVGSIMYIALDDKIMLMLSLPLSLLSAGRCVLLYRQIGWDAYECVEGVCIKIQKAPLRKQRSLCLITDSGIEHTVTLDARIPVRIGNSYRLFYLAATDDGPYQIFSAQQQFLALEDLGGYQVSDILQEAEEI
ncbi:MAG: hypothetical protein IIV13_02335 [Bacteroidaceae bacterium]|nr:hypothetical protein [Bacteroidaceae bacterium]